MHITLRHEGSRNNQKPCNTQGFSFGRVLTIYNKCDIIGADKKHPPWHKARRASNINSLKTSFAWQK
jgi:hypothetical protein